MQKKGITIGQRPPKQEREEVSEEEPKQKFTIGAKRTSKQNQNINNNM